MADGIFIWALNDFSAVDAEAVGHSFWVKGLQSSFGMFDKFGNTKPAAKVAKNAFKGR